MPARKPAPRRVVRFKPGKGLKKQPQKSKVTKRKSRKMGVHLKRL